MDNRLRRAKETAKTAWRLLKTGSLAASDVIIALSLMRKGTRPKPGTRTAWPKGLRETLYREQTGLCMYCRARLSQTSHVDVVRPISHIDHKVPVNQGGTNHPDNLQLLCAPCNLRKSDRNDAEFRHRYHSLLPQQQARMPTRRIKQSEFRSVTRTSPDAQSYTRFKGGKYLTANQKVNSGSIAAGVVAALAVFVPINQAATPEDASVLLIISLVLGGAAGLGVRIRARYTGKDQED